jgi:hypothetical protein
MQRMDSLDSTNHKIVFKKQSHRPWTPPIQKETPVLSSNTELNGFDSDRLLIGGFSFLKASSIPYESEQSQKSHTLIDKLKNKEQEAQTLSTSLKIVTALEQAEKIELGRKKDALARKAAEEKALCAMQQLHLTEYELQKTKKQLQIEQQLKTKEESVKKSLETEIKNALRAIEDNEHTIARETEARKAAEKKIDDTLSLLSEKEQHIRLQAEKTIKNNLRDFIEKEKSIEKTFEDRVASLQAEHKKQTLGIQIETNQKISEVIERERNIEKKFTDYINNLQAEYKEQTLKIKAEAEEKAHFHEKERIEAQTWIQKSEEASRLIALQKTELENNLASTIQNAVNQKAQYESKINDLREQIRQSEETISSMSIINGELKQQLSEALSKLNAVLHTEENTVKQIESLTLQIQQLKEQTISLENDKNELTKLFTDSLGKSKVLQSITNNERRLRILLEEKLGGKEFRKIDHNKKLFEQKILEIEALLAEEKTVKKSLEEKNKVLTEQIYSLEYAKQKETDQKETATYKVSELITKQQHFEQEKTNLEEKNKLLTEQIYNLEHAKQKETVQKETATYKVSELVAKQQHLEQEKTNLEEKYNTLATKSVEFEIMLASEQSLRKEAERLKMIEEQARKAAQEKISSAMAQANQTVLSVLDKYTMTKEKNKLLAEQIYSLEYAKQKETDEKETATHKASELVAKQQHLEQEKTSLEEKNKLLTEQIYSLEYAKQKETDEKETATHKVSELITKQQNFEQEKINLEEKNKMLTEQIYSLEQAKQKETDEKETATHKISELVSKQQHLEQEKKNLEEKYNTLATRSAELKIILESETCLRKEAEKLKTIEENARKAEQEKISSAMEQANKTVLAILGNYTTAEVSND